MSEAKPNRFALAVENGMPERHALALAHAVRTSRDAAQLWACLRFHWLVNGVALSGYFGGFHFPGLDDDEALDLEVDGSSEPGALHTEAWDYTTKGNV